MRPCNKVPGLPWLCSGGGWCSVGTGRRETWFGALLVDRSSMHFEHVHYLCFCMYTIHKFNIYIYRVTYIHCVQSDMSLFSDLCMYTWNHIHLVCWKNMDINVVRDGGSQTVLISLEQFDCCCLLTHSLRYQEKHVFIVAHCTDGLSWPVLPMLKFDRLLQPSAASAAFPNPALPHVWAAPKL